MSCSVRNCNSIRRLSNSSISFHNFPQQEPIKLLWLQALQLDENTFQWSRGKVVCSKHFQETDYNYTYKDGRRYLKKMAVPSLFLDTDNLSCDSSQISNVTATVSGLEAKASSSTSDSVTKESNITQTKIRKRKLNKQLQISSSTSSMSSGAKRRRVQFIRTIHSYSTSPSVLMKNNKRLKMMQNKYRKRMYDSRKKIKKMERKITSMNQVMRFLKDKNAVSHNSMNEISSSVDSVPSLIMSRYLKNIQNQTTTHETYPAPLRNFAATLQFYSSRAYEEVRSTFALALPSQATIRKWFSNINCTPGYTDTSFQILEKKCLEAAENNREVICSLMLDEMSIKKQIESDGKKIWGYTDIGVPIENDQQIPASNALVLMVVSVNSQWKLPVAYFLLKGISAQEQANIVKECLTRLNQVGVKVTSVTCDGPSGHFSMFKELGCDFEDHSNLKAYFLNPETSEKIFSIFDACHMLKLARNVLYNLKQFKDPSGRMIKWSLIEKLQQIQTEETLNLGNKLNASHIKWQTQKMKVALAAQTLSRSVADALKFLRLDIKHPGFLDSEATEEFIYKIDSLFDILNSRNPYSKGLKAVLRESREDIWRPFLQETKNYLLGCTDAETGRPLHMTANKTSFLGFAITIDAVIGVFDEYVKTKRLDYLLTYKFSQDHLETFFCSIRSRNGWNNNPSALQFFYAYRRLLLHTRVSGRGGNCRVIDSTVVLTIPSSSKKSEVTVDVAMMRKFNLEANDVIIEDHDYDCTANYIPLTELSSNVVTYISGFVIKMLEKRNICMDCLVEGAISCTAENLSNRKYMLIRRKDRGGLRIPSPGLVRVCEATEIKIRKLMAATDNKLPNDDGFQKAFVLSVSQLFFKDVYEIFPCLTEHFLEAAPLEEHHGFILVKAIVDCYSRIRFFNLQKRYTEKIQGLQIRKKLTKLILFSNQ